MPRLKALRSTVAALPPRLGYLPGDTKAQDKSRNDLAPWRAWYKLARWRRIRARQLQEHPLCKMCEAEGRVTAATVCDHITPHRGDPNLFWNGPFQSLCDHHHNATKQAEERANG